METQYRIVKIDYDSGTQWPFVECAPHTVLADAWEAADLLTVVTGYGLTEIYAVEKRPYASPHASWVPAERPTVPPSDRIPVIRQADCRYCLRYDKPCGRHESLSGSQSVSDKSAHPITPTATRSPVREPLSRSSVRPGYPCRCMATLPGGYRPVCQRHPSGGYR